MDTDPRLPAWNDWKPLGLQQLDAPVDTGEFTDPTEHEESTTAKAKIGSDGQGREVYYDPDFAKNKLPNAHLTITGESGSGKTQAMKSIMADLATQHVPALVLDFKDDYSDPVYADKENFRVFDPTKQSLPINPLAPSSDTDGLVNPTFHSYQLSEIVSRIYRLGDLQGHKLREAIKGVYTDAGIPMSAHKPAENMEWPSFQSVKDKLSGDKDATELIGHMSPIFDFGLFEGSGSELGGLGGVATSNTVIRLGQLPGNEVKNSVAEFFLMALYNHLIRQPQTSSLHQILVLDEAWRVVNSPFLEPLMRESRAFGLGIFVATQFPTDLPQTVSGNAGTKIYFSQSSPTQVNEIARNISGKPYGTQVADEVQNAIRDLKPLHCLVANKQYEPYATVAADPYYARTQETSMRELPQPTAGRNFNQSKGDNHRRAEKSPHTEQAHEERVDFWKDNADSVQNYDDGTWHDPNNRKYVQQVDGQFTCGGCGFATDNDTDELGRHVCDYCKTRGSLNGQIEGQGVPNLPEQYKGWWKHEDHPEVVTAAADAPLFPPCKYCNEIKGFKSYPFANGTLECRGCGNLDGAREVADRFNNMLLDHSLDLAQLPQTSHPLGDANAAIKTGASYTNEDGSTTCCGAQTSISMDDGVEYCKGCYEPIEGDREQLHSEYDMETGQLKPRTSELQPFPPGEGTDDGNPFAPFSMSEWQMVKGPKLKGRGKGQ